MPKKTEKPKEQNKQTYEGKPANSLILLGIFSVAEASKKCTFERLVAECFSLSPKTFSFNAYPHWPDARKLDRPLRALRDDGLVSGDPKTQFELTKQGRVLAEEIARTFRQAKLEF